MGIDFHALGDGTASAGQIQTNVVRVNPLARAIIGGVLSAASLSLLVVPYLYVIFKRDRREARIIQ